MNRQKRSFIAIILIAGMLLSFVPAPAFAAESGASSTEGSVSATESASDESDASNGSDASSGNSASNESNDSIVSTGPAVSTGAAVTPTPTPRPLKLVDAEIVDGGDQTRVPYQSQYDETNITIKATYDDGSEQLVHPDSLEGFVDTSTLGVHEVTAVLGDRTFHFSIVVVPAKVSGVHMAQGTQTAISVEWDAQEEAEVYEVYTSKTEKGEFELVGTTEETSYRFENMTPGVIIYVKIRAVSGELYGDYSKVTPIAPTPEKVTGKVNMIKSVKTKITLDWQAAAGATGYAIYYRLSTDQEYTLSGTTTNLNYQATGLKAGKDYYFIVYAYGATPDNLGGGSEEVLFGTAPALPVITKVDGGQNRIKVYWNKGTGASSFRIYISTAKKSGYQLATTVSPEEYKLRGIGGLLQKKKYYVKIEAVRKVAGMELISVSDIGSAKTKKAKSTSTAAKLYKTKKQFESSALCKKYKKFKKNISFNKSIVLPGMKNTNVAGFNATRMVPQGITFAGDYLLITAYDYSKQRESVIYVMNKNTGKYITTIVMPHTGHMGGIAYDGVNVWYTYGKNLHCIKYSVIRAAAKARKTYLELYKVTAVCPMPETMSYVAYYNGKVWAGAYDENAKKYLYGYTISNKSGTPSLTQTNRILMPNRTQGIAFTSDGKLLISRSCQTKEGMSGFMSRIDVYKPDWSTTESTIKKGSMIEATKMPPMNEGIAVRGSYTYVAFESPAFSECVYPMDRVAAFKTSKLT